MLVWCRAKTVVELKRAAGSILHLQFVSLTLDEKVDALHAHDSGGATCDSDGASTSPSNESSNAVPNCTRCAARFDELNSMPRG